MNREHRPSLAQECAATLGLAVPIVLGQLSGVLMGVVDSALAGHLGARPLAAVGVGSAVWSSVLMLAIGVMLAVPPSVSQLDGARRREEIGPLFRQALWLALGVGVLLGALVRHAEPLLVLMRVAPEVVPDAMRFLRAVSWGAPALALFFAQRGLSEGLSVSRPTMYFGFVGLSLIGPVGYVLMYGKLGFEPMGAAGAGAATAIVLWVQALGFALYLALRSHYAGLSLFSHFEPPRPRAIAGLLSIGLPMGIAIFMEGSTFILTSLLVSSLGTTIMAGHQVALMAASVSFMIPLGIGMATTVRVGNAVGRRDGGAVRRAGLAGFVLTLGTQSFSCLAIAFGASTIARGFTTDTEVLAVASSLLVVAAAFQFSDGIQAYFNGALRGLKDVTVPMGITLLAYWVIGLPFGTWLGFSRGWGARGLWFGLTAGLTVAALLLMSRFAWLIRREGLRARVGTTTAADPCRVGE